MPELEVGYRIKQLLDTRGLTQAQLSEKSGLPPATISHFITGLRTPGTSSLRKLSDALGVTVEYLLGITEEPKLAGDQAKVIFRNAQQLSEESLKMLAAFSKLLAEQDAEKKKPDES
jgi:transcriptional regulator with XRE-family HTH domain